MDYEDICRRDKKGPPGSARTASSFPCLYARVQSANCPAQHPSPE